MTMSILLVAAMLTAATPGHGLTVTAAPKGFIVTATEFPTTEAATVVAEQKVLAAERCGKLSVRWGRFSYDNAKRTADGQMTSYITNYRQNFSCFDPATDPYKPAPAGWTATPEDDAAVLSFARRYFQAFDAGDAKVGVPMMEPIAEIDKATWLASNAGFRAVAGKGERTFGKVEWLLNDPNFAHPGVFARVYFRGAFDKLAAHCGVMVFYRQAPGKYYVSQQNIEAITQESVDAGRVSAENARKVCGG